MRRTIQGTEHLKRLAEMPCMFCGTEPCGEPHHVRYGTDGGMGIKPSDKYAIPTCHDCHCAIHTKGELTFYQKKGFSIDAIHNKALGFWEGLHD